MSEILSNKKDQPDLSSFSVIKSSVDTMQLVQKHFELAIVRKIRLDIVCFFYFNLFFLLVAACDKCSFDTQRYPCNKKHIYG